MEATKIFDPNAPKKSVNLSANSDLLLKAKEKGINLSQTFEAALVVSLREKLEERWREENKEAIAAYNEHIERDGVFGSRTRKF